MVPQLSREGRGWCPCILAEGRRASPDSRHVQRQEGRRFRPVHSALPDVRCLEKVKPALVAALWQAFSCVDVAMMATGNGREQAAHQVQSVRNRYPEVFNTSCYQVAVSERHPSATSTRSQSSSWAQPRDPNTVGQSTQQTTRQEPSYPTPENYPDN